MSESNSLDPEPRKKRFSRFSEIFKRRPEPEDREDIKAILEGAHERGVIDGEAYTMISGALDVASKTVADIMVPRSKIDTLDITKPLKDLLPAILETGRSRFPVYEEDRDNIIGVLLAKDLLLSIANPAIDLRPLIRPAVFIPETKRLNVLLHEFRSSRNHIAIVIDEHGSTAGLITMEDVLEQIVGDIEDEYDEDTEQTIFQAGNNGWRVMATTEIQDFNEAFNTEFTDHEYDTIGGWLAYELGHIPRRGETLTHQGVVVTVVKADAKRALWLHVQRDTPSSSADNTITNA